MTNPPDDRLLTQYLLRALPEEEAERLDELSVADDDFAARLSSAENDLVDAYVRGELPPEESARFRSAYLSSPKRCDKVRFAETFLSFQQRVAGRPVVIRAVAAEPEKRESAWARLSRWFGGVRSGTSRASNAWFAPQWGLAGAALLLLLASGYLLNTNLRLRQQVSRSESARTALAQHEKDLQNQLATKTAGTSRKHGSPHRTINRPVEGCRLRPRSFTSGFGRASHSLMVSGHRSCGSEIGVGIDGLLHLSGCDRGFGDPADCVAERRLEASI